MKAGTHNHLKTKRLKRLLGVPLYRAVGILETLWLLCADCCDEGNIGKFSNEEIADYLEWDGDASELVRCLSDSGWIDRDEEHGYVIHDWLEHCPEYIRDRVRKRAARGSKPRKQKTYVSSEPDKVGQTPDAPALRPSMAGQGNSIQFQPIQSVCSETDAKPPSAEPPPPPKVVEPAVMEFPCDGNPNAWRLTKSQVDEWQSLFPSLDIRSECRNALAWVLAVPTRRKTARGMQKFLVGWFGKSQNRGVGNRPAPNGPSLPAQRSPVPRLGDLQK